MERSVQMQEQEKIEAEKKMISTFISTKGRNVRSAKEFLADQIKFETQRFDRLRLRLEEEDEKGP